MVHCLFEQSGTFKNEFKKLGMEAQDYDILNDFGETDNVIDLFEEINNGYMLGTQIEVLLIISHNHQKEKKMKKKVKI